MARDYDLEPHFLVKFFEEEGIVFPISKEELLDKFGDKQFQINAAYRMTTLNDFMGIVEIDQFENRHQFFCALAGGDLQLDF